MTFKAYWEKYRSYIIGISFFAFLLHGSKINSEIIGIDTEDLIHLQEDFYNGWLTTGRHGLVLFKQITDTLQFQPYFAGLLTVLLLALGVASFVLLWSNIAGKKHWGLLAGAFLWISHPILTEQLYFSLQSVEICAGIMLTAISLYWTKCFAEQIKWYSFAGSVTLLLVTFAMYQVFVPFYIFGTVTILLLQAIDDMEKVSEGSEKCENQSEKKYAGYDMLSKLGMTLPYIAVFLSAFVGNSLITNFCFAKSEYLERQILWGSVPVGDNFHAIAAHIGKTLIGYGGVYYHFSYGILVLLAIGLGLAYILPGRELGKKLVPLLYLAAALVAPYLLVLVCGGSTVIRSQLILPAATCFLAYFDCRLLGTLYRRYQTKTDGCSQETLFKFTQDTKSTKQRNRIWRVLLAVAGVCLCFAIVTGAWKQTYTTMSLYYTDKCRYEQDEALGRELIFRIEEVRGEENYPVVVIGKKPFAANYSNVQGETIGKSLFDYDAEVGPKYFWSTKRILGFLHTLGKEYPQVALESMSEAYAYSEDMPEFPAQGSVQLINDMVIVKLEVE